jgi:general secretion pathway protein H
MSRNSRSASGFTLVELSIVLFVLGLVLWIVAPRLSAVGGVSRSAAFRTFSSNSEAAFDGALFEKKEWILLLDPKASSYRFIVPGGKREPGDPLDFGTGVTVTGLTVEGDERSLESIAEIRYLPGGKVAEAFIRLRDASRDGTASDWTLHLDPTSGSVDVLEGSFSKNAT